MTIKKMKEESENLKIKFEVEKTQAAVKVLQEEDYAVLEDLNAKCVQDCCRIQKTALRLA